MLSKIVTSLGQNALKSILKVEDVADNLLENLKVMFVLLKKNYKEQLLKKINLSQH